MRSKIALTQMMHYNIGNKITLSHKKKAQLPSVFTTMKGIEKRERIQDQSLVSMQETDTEHDTSSHFSDSESKIPLIRYL